MVVHQKYLAREAALLANAPEVGEREISLARRAVTVLALRLVPERAEAAAAEVLSALGLMDGAAHRLPEGAGRGAAS